MVRWAHRRTVAVRLRRWVEVHKKALTTGVVDAKSQMNLVNIKLGVLLESDAECGQPHHPDVRLRATSS